MKPAAASAVSLLLLSGCARHVGPLVVSIPSGAMLAVRAARRVPGSPAALPLDIPRPELAACVVDSLRKRVMGRLMSRDEVVRVVRDVAPVVDASSRQPAAREMLARMAADRGIPAEQMRAEWVAAQQADLLLESGGDPDAVSSSNAVGVAQWMTGTARAHGLSVNLADSVRLTGKIGPLKRKLAWFEYLASPGADVHAPGAPAVSPADAAQALPALRAELEMLRAKRQRADARYDPEHAIFAQTRYLLKLYARFPSVDWLFQAYHGGEGAVTTELSRYLGHNERASCAAAIDTGRAGAPLRFEDLYFGVSPAAHSQAFAYLYGRSDDHRHYWWKIRAAEAALAAYRADPNFFDASWAALLPGRMMDAVWYPQGPEQSLPDLAALRSARRAGELVPVGSVPGVRLVPEPLDQANAATYKALRPVARGALLLIAAEYRRFGMPEQLTVGDLTLTQGYDRRVRERERGHNSAAPTPPDPLAASLPGGGPPADFDYHTTGFVFDLVRPHDARALRNLQYVLGALEDREVIACVEAKDEGERRFHVVPNPRYSVALERIAASGRVPRLPG